MRPSLCLLALLLGPLFVAPTFAADPEGPLEDVLAQVAADRLFREASVAVQVVDVATGEEVWSRDADVALNPASTTKLVTAATALRTLGPSYTFETTVAADTRVPPDGVLPGSLYVRGTGDPTMVVEKLWRLCRDLELAGLKVVEGDLVLDESHFGPDHELPGWDKARDIERGPSYFPALSALSLNFNTAAVVVRPGAPGEAAVVQFDTPAEGYLTLAASVTTGRAGTRRSLLMDREVVDGGMLFTLRGTVPANDIPRRFYRTVDDPTRYFGHALRGVLAERGIEVRGDVVLGTVPDGAEQLAALTSPPLTSILMDTNKYSSNFMAEQVLRAVGAARSGQGTVEAGLEAVREYLAGLGVREGYALYNGSGLAREGALSPAALNAVLLDMARDPRVGSEFRSSLAIAGLDGTLRSRLLDAPGRLRGKTGTLDGVHGLAGYVESADGALYAFAFLANGFRGGSANVKRVHDDFARRMFELSTDAAADPTR